MTAAVVSPVAEATSELLTSVRRYRKQSNIGVIVGICGHTTGILLSQHPTSSVHNLGIVFFILATFAWFYGFAYYAKAKGRSFGWAILGVFGLTGLIILSFLSDRNAAAYPQTKKVPWTRKVILGLIIFMILFGGFVSFMGSRSKHATPQPDREMTQLRVQHTT